MLILLSFEKVFMALLFKKILVWCSTQILRELRYFIPRKPLFSTIKVFMMFHLDCCDVIYEKPRNEKFIYILQSTQRNSTLAKTGAIKGKSK